MYSINDVLIFLAVFIGVCLAIAVLVLLIIALINLIKTLRRVNKILADNAENIGKTVKKLPELAENIDETVAAIGSAVDDINETFFAPPANSANDTLLTIVGIAENVAKIVVNVLNKKK